MRSRRGDLWLASVLSIAVHGAALGAAGWWITPHSPRASGEAVAKPALPIELVLLDPAEARAMLEPAAAAAAAAAALREATVERHPWAPLPAPSPLPVRPPVSPLLPPSLPRPDVTIAGNPPPPSPAPAEHLPALSWREVAVLQKNPQASRDPKATPKSAPADPSPAEGPPPATAAPPATLSGSPNLVTRRVPVVYPPEARRRGIQGTTTVGVEVSPRDGSVARAWVIRSSGHRMLDRAALQSLRAWRFDPGAIEASRIGWRFRQEVSFELK